MCSDVIGGRSPSGTLLPLTEAWVEAAVCIEYGK